jgi:hypothetical protein
LDTASSTPVYPAMNSPTSEPSTAHMVPAAPSSSRAIPPPAPVRLARSPASAATKETVTNAPNTTSAQAPTDIGDHDLKVGACSPGVVLTSMCQNRSGLPRSSVSRTGHTRNARNAT